MTERVLHCWKDRAEDALERTGERGEEWAEAWLHNGTCMLEGGHAGPHRFTDDDAIGISFADVPRPS